MFRYFFELDKKMAIDDYTKALQRCELLINTAPKNDNLRELALEKLESPNI